MIILAIDPGTEHSGVVRYEPGMQKVLAAADLPNEEILLGLRTGDLLTGKIGDPAEEVLVIEDIEPMGFAVGASTLTTKEWIGRFREACERRFGRVAKLGRGDVKVFLCGGSTYKDPETGKRKTVSDAQVRRALLDRFPQTGGGKEPAIGVKKQPGPLFGVAGHMFSALALAVVWAATERSSR